MEYIVEFYFIHPFIHWISAISLHGCNATIEIDTSPITNKLQPSSTTIGTWRSALQCSK